VINSDKIEEWIQEVEERPTSASNILRYIANRLIELSSRNERLKSENIELRLGHKVEEYESRIANLEYQLELLKRQLGGELPQDTAVPVSEALSLILSESQGNVLRVEVPLDELAAGKSLAHFAGPIAPEMLVHLLVTNAREELLLVFSSGRTEAVPVERLPLCQPDHLNWSEANFFEPRAGEELVTVMPIARMSLFDYCIQTSRKGYVKKIKEAFFENHLTKNYIGTGVRLPADRTLSLTFCKKDDLLTLVTREGYLQTVEIEKLPFTIEEVLRLGTSDYVQSTFTLAGKPSILLLTQNGKVIHRDAGWLEPSTAFKSRGQSAYSQSRRESGVRIVGADAVDELNWGIILTSDGKLVSQRMADLFAAGSVEFETDQVEVLGFTTFTTPDVGNQE